MYPIFLCFLRIGRQKKNNSKNKICINFSEKSNRRAEHITTPMNPIVRYTEDAEPGGEMILEKILEEDGNYGEERNHQREYHSPDAHNENDKKHLLGNGHHTINVHITRI